MKQLILIADMEGASGIFEGSHKWLWNGHEDWRNFGRDCITSDALAVCNGAIDFGIDDILLYDMHWAGDAEFNIKLEELPAIVRTFNVPNREARWREIRSQAAQNPFGLITLGQHARFSPEPQTNYCTKDAYFLHTIQTPPIKNFFVNGLHIAEIGMGVLSFSGVPYLANIGCQASMKEALELSSEIICLPVKDRAKGWEPSPQQTYPLIYEGTIKALEQASGVKGACIKPPYSLSMELCEEFVFKNGDNKIQWTAQDIFTGFEIFYEMKATIEKRKK